MKTFLDNLSPELTSIASSLKPVTQLYVSTTTGDDNNDGSINKPVKTLNRVGYLLSNRHNINTVVNVDAGEYVDVIYLTNISGNVTFVTNGTCVIRPDNNASGHGSLVNIVSCSGDIVFERGFTLKIDKNVSCVTLLNGGVYFMGVTFDASAAPNMIDTACYGARSTARFQECSFKNFKDVIYADYGSQFFGYGNDYGDCKSYHATYGSLFVTHQGGLKNSATTNAIPSVKEIMDGIIIETGSNENGQYIKYANGIIIMYSRIDPFLPNSPKLDVVIPLPASAVNTLSVTITAETYRTNLKPLHFFGNPNYTLTTVIETTDGTSLDSIQNSVIALNVHFVGYWK